MPATASTLFDEPAPPISGPAGLAAAVGAPPARGHALAFWAAHAAFWGLAFAVQLLLIRAFRPEVNDPPSFVLLEVTLCFVAAAAMRAASQRDWLLARVGLSKIGVIAGGAIFSAVLITLVLFVASRSFGLSPPPRPELVARFAVTLVMLSSWCSLYFGYQLINERNLTEVRALQAESLALRKELEHLQGQISPHFLFNSLNTVIACREDPEAIDTVTQALANYLRFLLRPAARLEPLSRELDALEDYLTIQAARFGDGLETRIDCDVDARRVEVPPVMVQPLVENAIKYGGRTAPPPIRVQVTARRAGERLTVEVANAGRWVPAGERQSTGTGLASLERRLRLLVGPEASVAHREEEGWVRVVIGVPVRGGNGRRGPAG